MGRPTKNSHVIHMKIAGKMDDHLPNHAISMYFLRFDP
jgi:hypothetical protein